MLQKFQKKSYFLEFLQILRFGTAGIIATLIHMVVVFLLASYAEERPFLVNLIGYLVAFLFAFVMHFFWTFKHDSKISSALIKYFTISLFAFLMANVFLKLGIEILALPNLYIILLSILVVPPITYLASRFWAFKSGGHAT